MPINSFDDYPMTWRPARAGLHPPFYRALAVQLEHDILSGRLSPHTKLPPQRELADYLDLNLSTVTRAFRICTDKGLFRISCCIRQRCIRRDERPAPNNCIDQPLVRTETKGARHRAQIKIEEVGKLPLRRELCMRRQSSAEDITFKLNGKRTIKRRMKPRAYGTPRHRIIIKRIDGHITSPATLSYIQFYC